MPYTNYSNDYQSSEVWALITNINHMKLNFEDLNQVSAIDVELGDIKMKDNSSDNRFPYLLKVGDKCSISVKMPDKENTLVAVDMKAIFLNYKP
jgi:hypothetical protein